MPVGSMPYLTRSGFPVFTLRSSFWRNSGSGTISAPRRMRANCSSTVFTALARSERLPNQRRHQGLFAGNWGDTIYSAKLLVHLKAPGRFKGISVMTDQRFFALSGPAEDEHIETSGLLEQAVPLKKMQGQIRQTALFGQVDGGSGFGD